MGFLTSDKINTFLTRSLYTSLVGVTTRDWIRLLRENRFAVDPRYWHRAALITLNSITNSVHRWREDRRFGRAVASTKVESPIFILGHWRSGTTHLHHLLTQDSRFAFPNLYQAFYPHTFLSREDSQRFWSLLLPKNRLIDNVAMSFKMPFEDEYATCALTFRSPYMSWVFPRRWTHYDEYLTFEGVPEPELEEWKRAFVLFLKKLTLKYGRPLILKSPPHTCRIPLLLEMFPDARFIHIHRDPYTVFSSTRKVNEFAAQSMQLQHCDLNTLDDLIIKRYRVMYDAFFRDRSRVPPGQLHEVAFEDLERDPVGQVRAIYRVFAISGFEEFQPKLEAYLQSVKGYRKNRYPRLEPSLQARIARTWRMSFEEWGYSA